MPYLYCLWAAIAMVAAVAIKGWTPENVTRVLVVAFLLVQFAFWMRGVRSWLRLGNVARSSG